MADIAEKYLSQLRQRASAGGVCLELSSGLGAHLCREASGRWGARQIRRAVQEQVEGPLAGYLLEHPEHSHRIRITLDENRVCISG